MQLIALLFLLAMPSWASITINHISLPTGSSGASPTTFTITTTTGNAIVVCMVVNSPASVSAVTDSANNGYTSVGVEGTATAGNTYCWNTTVTVATGVTSIKVTHTSTGVAIVAYDLSVTSGSILVDAKNNVNSTTSANPAPSFTATAGDLVISVLASNNNPSAVASPFTMDSMSSSGITNWDKAAHYNNVAGGTTTSTYTMTSALWSAVIAAFKEPAATTCTPAMALIGVGRCG